MSGGKTVRKRFWVVGDVAFPEMRLPWCYRGLAAGRYPSSPAGVCVNVLGAFAMEKVFKLVTEVVQDRTGLTLAAGLLAPTGRMSLSRDR